MQLQVYEQAAPCGAICCDFWKVGGGICDSLLQKLVTVTYVTVSLLGSRSSSNSWAKSSIMILISPFFYVTTS